ncbi:MAG: hypothetical protein PHP70_12930, partial [Gallionella sp.]|nr:hypothetical protein [Gallionella sp.]
MQKLNVMLITLIGQGSVYSAGVLLDGGQKNGDANHYKSADGVHNYTILSGDINAADGATLVVDGNLTIEHFRKGNLGIVLDSAQNYIPPAGTTLVG